MYACKAFSCKWELWKSWGSQLHRENCMFPDSILSWTWTSMDKGEPCHHNVIPFYLYSAPTLWRCDKLYNPKIQNYLVGCKIPPINSKDHCQKHSERGNTSECQAQLRLCRFAQASYSWHSRAWRTCCLAHPNLCEGITKLPAEGIAKCHSSCNSAKSSTFCRDKALN